MTYATTNPPLCHNQAIAGIKVWTYQSTDGASTVDAAGYITNGQDLGMKAGDIVIVVDTDASPVIITTHRVVSLSTTDRSVDLSNGDTTVTGTNSD